MRIDEFDKIFCINLPKRTDRRKIADDYFKSIDLNVDFMDGIDGDGIKESGKIKPGHKGCVLSHKKIYELCYKNGYNKVLILEDDVEFDVDFKNKFELYYKEIPEDWHLLYFGGNHNSLKLDLISSHVHRLKLTYTTHCYAINGKSLPYLIKEFNRPDLFDQEVDVHISNIQSKIPSYGFHPPIAWQREGFSDIEKRIVNYDFLKDGR